LAVRKIPLKERSYLVEDAASVPSKAQEVEAGSDERAEDPTIEDTLQKIRVVVLQDRDIHDKVRPHGLQLDVSTLIRSS